LPSFGRRRLLLLADEERAAFCGSLLLVDGGCFVAEPVV